MTTCCAAGSLPRSGYAGVPRSLWLHMTPTRPNMLAWSSAERGITQGKIGARAYAFTGSHREGGAMLEGCVPFPPDMADTYRRLGYWQARPIGAYVQDWARRYGERIALMSEGERIT